MPVPEADVTYYAIWDTAEITFNRRNGAAHTEKVDGKDVTINDTISTITASVGALVPFPADPTYLNHTFLGWSTEKGDKEKIVDPATTVVTADMIESGMTYYAVYEYNHDKTQPIFFVTADKNQGLYHAEGNKRDANVSYDAENDIVYVRFTPLSDKLTAGSCNMYGLGNHQYTTDADKLYLVYYLRTNITGKAPYIGMYSTTNKDGTKASSFTREATTVISDDSADKWQKLVVELANMSELGICPHMDLSAVGNTHTNLSPETHYFDIGAIALFEDKEVAEAFDIKAASAASTVKLSFDTHGGSAVADMDVANGAYTQSTIEIPVPTKENYTFKGWATSLHGTPLAAVTNPTKDTKYYAVWEMANPAAVSDTVYISNNGCNTCNNGFSAAHPVATLAKANEIIAANAGIKNVVVVGTFTTAKDEDVLGVAGRDLTVTGYNSSAVFDYDANKSGTDDDLVLACNVTFKNITLNDGSGDGMLQVRGNTVTYAEGVSGTIEVAGYSGSSNTINIYSGKFGRVIPGKVSNAEHAGTTTINMYGGEVTGSGIVMGHGWRDKTTFKGSVYVNIHGGTVSQISMNATGTDSANSYMGLRYFTINDGTVANIITTEGSLYKNNGNPRKDVTVTLRDGVTVFEINKAGALTGTVSLGTNVVNGKAEADNSTRILLFNNGSYVDGKVKDTGAITVNTKGGVLKAVVDVDSSYNATLKGYSFTPALESYDRAEINGEVYELSEFEGGNIPANMFKAGTNTVEFFEEIEEGKTVTFVNDGEIVQSGLVAVGTVPTAPVLTKTGYTLTWDKEIVAVTEEVTYTAVWTANEYDVTFNAGEGTFADGKTVTVKTVFNSAITAPANPTREGYVFFGWDKTIGNLTTEGATFNAVWEANHVAAYRAQGYDILYVEGSDLKSSVAANTAAGKKVVFALKDDLNLAENLTLTNNGGTFVITSAGGNINFGTCSITFGTDKDADITFDHIALSKTKGERGINAVGNNLTLTETVTVSSGEGTIFYVNAAGDGGDPTQPSNGNTITIETPSKVSVRGAGWSGNFTNGNVNFVFGKNAQAYLTAAGKVGNDNQPDTKGNITVTVKDNAKLLEFALAEGKSFLTGNLDVTIKDNAAVDVFKIASTVTGNATINIQGGTVPSVAITDGKVTGRSSVIVDTDNATVGTITGTFTANKHNVIYTLDGEEYNKAEVAYGTNVEILAAPTKEGYTFSGWSKTEAFTMPDEDVTITGTFTKNTPAVPTTPTYKTYGKYDSLNGKYTVEVKFVGAKVNQGSFGFNFPADEMTFKSVQANADAGIELLGNVSPIYAKGEGYYADTWAVSDMASAGHIDATNEEILIATFEFSMTKAQREAFTAGTLANGKFAEYTAVTSEKYYNGTNYIVTIHAGDFPFDRQAVVYESHTDEEVASDITYTTYGKYDEYNETYSIDIKVKGAKINLGAFGLAFNEEYMTFDPEAENAVVLADNIANYLGITLHNDADGYAFAFDGSSMEDGYVDASEEEVLLATINLKMTKAQREAFENAGKTMSIYVPTASDNIDAVTLAKYYDGENYLVSIYVPGLATPKLPAIYASHSDEVKEATVADVKVEVTFALKNGATNTNIAQIKLDDGEAVALEEKGNVEATLSYTFKALEIGKTYTVTVEKNGYIAGVAKISVVKGSNEIKMTLIAGDIKGAATAVCGDGKVDLSDFVRVIRAFDENTSADFEATVDLDENGAVNVTDISIIKSNFNKTAVNNIIVVNGLNVNPIL